MFSLRSVLRGPRAAARSRRTSSFQSKSFGLGQPLSLESLEDRRLLTFSTALVADISGPGSSQSQSFVSVGDTALFVAQGNQLWRSDGTEAGTQLITTLSGLIGSDLAVVDGLAYFSLREPGNVVGIWKSDGTSLGTQRVVALPSGAFGEVPNVIEFAAVGDTLFFTVRTGGDRVLWKTDGSEIGTSPVKSFTSAHEPFDLTNVSGTLFFTAGDDQHGRELWASDGTELGTTMVRDINPGTESMLRNPYSGEMQAVDGRLFFRATDGIHGEELWKSDGTAAGTVLVADTRLGSESSDPDQYFRVGNAVYFVADDGVHGKELWRSEGTDASTTLMKDINPGPASSLRLPRFTEMQGELYFYATDDGSSWQVWKSDGTAAGTTVLTQIQFPLIDPTDIVPKLSMASLGDTLVFVDFDAEQGYSLWRSMGTTESTSLLMSYPGQASATAPAELTNLGGNLFFTAISPQHGDEPWFSDGTPEGTRLLKDVNPNTSGYVQVSGALTVGAVTYFVAGTNGVNGNLWRTDGTAAGTRRVDSTDSAWASKGLTEVNGVVYFSRYDDHGSELWRTDGTDSGTWRVADIQPGAAGSAPNYLTNVNGKLYFWADDGVHGRELWKSDGTEAGTTLVRDIRPGEVDSSLGITGTIYNSAGELLFFANDGVHGDELWRSDGTQAGTALVKDIRPGSASSAGRVLLTTGGTAILEANDGTHGRELWRTDGTAAGTELIEDVRPGIATSIPLGVVVFQDDVYFTADDGVHGRKLWKAPISSGGAQLAESLNAAAEDVGALVPIGDQLFLTLRDDQLLYQLAAMDAANEVELLANVRPQFPVNSAGTLVFFALSSNTEVWTSDGTQPGTMFVGATPLPTVDFGAHSKSDLTYFWTESSGPWVVTPPVVARLFYNNSAFDQAPASTMDDNDAALAVDKLPYIPGNGRATSENVSSYSKGINGLFIDLASGHGEITADDFNFRMGTSTDPGGWNDSPAPISITVRAGAGIAGHDRVEIVFADDAIKNTWLEVTVRGNDARGGFHANTALNASSVFYFGSRVGDTFTSNSAAAAVTSAADALQIRAAGGTFAASGNRFDINRDGVVSAGDALLARFNSGILLMLDLPQLTDPPASPTMIAATQMADPLSSAVASALAEALARHVDASAAASSHASGLIDRVPTTGPPSANATAREAAAHFADEALLELTEGESLDETAAEDDRLLDALLSLS